MTLCCTAKKRHKQKVGDGCFAPRNDRPAVDGLRHDEAGNETDGVEDGEKEYEVSRNTEQKRRGFADRPPLRVFGQNCRLSGHGSPPSPPSHGEMRADTGCR
jgi:hypothetical protein